MRMKCGGQGSGQFYKTSKALQTFVASGPGFTNDSSELTR